MAVATMSTRLSGSSIQSTGTSWMRSPAFSASTSISVSKNQPVSCTMRQQPLGHVAADRLEAALRITEPRGQSASQHEVVAARDQLTLGSPYDVRTACQPAADREVGVAGDQRGDQRQQRVEVGREVDVHVGQDIGVGARATPATARGRDPSARAGPMRTWGSCRDMRRAITGGVVGAGVVRDGDAVGVREVVAQVLVEAADGGLELRLLVVDGDDDVEDGWGWLEATCRRWGQVLWGEGLRWSCSEVRARVCGTDLTWLCLACGRMRPPVTA